MFRKGLLVIVSGPSGTGKGTLLKLVQESNSSVRFSVSATTRQPRQGEVDGQNYFYKTIDEFKDMIENNELIEWVQYCDNYYGTPKKYIENCMSQGYDIILEIEVEGALKIMEKYPDCVSIFILPPSFDELRRRIEGRGTEKVEVIEKRLETAKKELQYVDKYSYAIINDDLQTAADNINCLLKAEKLKFARNEDILKEIGL